MSLSDHTAKQQEFIKNFVKTKNMTQSALASYETTDPATAGVIGHRLLKNDKIKKTIDEHLELAGYSPTDSITRLKNTAIKAQKSRPTASDGTNADKLLLQLSNNLIERKQTTSVNVNVESLDKSELLKLKQKYDKMLKPSK